jgi:MFS family permease
MTISPFAEEGYDFPSAERATLSGGPANPYQPAWRRPICAVVGLLTGLTGGLGNGLITVNTSTLLGALGLQADEIAWIPTVYAMTYISMNLLLVRFRQQFGLRLFSLIALSAFSLVIALHLTVQGFLGAVLVHAAAGVAAAPMTSLSVYYLMSAFPPKKALAGVILGLGLSQLPTPLARLLSTDLLARHEWHSLYLFEFGMALICLGCVALVRLPPSKREPAFERLDFLTYPLFAGGASLVCAVMGMGRVDWWTDANWLGWTLAAAIPLLGAAFYIEANRARPLIDLHWLGTPGIVRFAVVVLMSRIVLVEQSTSVIGMLGVLGVENDELRFFSLLLLIASIAGALAAAMLVRPGRITLIGALAIGLVAFGAMLDSSSTNLTRPPELYVSQMLIAFATTLFIGPSLLFGVSFVVRQGGKALPSLLVLFVVLQILGSLIGGALLGTFQIIREKAISVILVGQLSATDPMVAARLRGSSAVLAPSNPDGAQRGGDALALLHQQMTREATILSYNNTFALVAALAAGTTLYLLILVFLHWRRGEPLSAAAATTTARGATS